MKILMLNYEFPPLGGGAANQTYYTLKEFYGNENISIDLVTSSVSGFNISDVSSNVKIHYLDINKKGSLHSQSNKDLLMYSAKAYFYSKKLIKSNKYDFVHAVIGIPCAYIAMKLNLPYLISLVGSDVPFHTPKYKLLDKYFFKYLSKRIWRKSKFVIANSQGLKDEALVSSPKQKIEVIYNGIDTKEFKPNFSNKKKEKLKIISVGRLAEHKGYKYLIEAVSGIENAELRLIGDGNHVNELKELSQKLKTKVNFKGRLERKEVIKELQEADIFVLPSLNEGMSNAIMEAMACGLPIIATNVGGSVELVKDNGFIVEKENSEALREKILIYLKDKDLLISQGEKSRKKAETLSWEKVAQEYLEIYNLC